MLSTESHPYLMQRLPRKQGHCILVQQRGLELLKMGSSRHDLDHIVHKNVCGKILGWVSSLVEMRRSVWAGSVSWENAWKGESSRAGQTLCASCFGFCENVTKEDWEKCLGRKKVFNGRDSDGHG